MLSLVPDRLYGDVAVQVTENQLIVMPACRPDL